jgi:hypothetical protein
VSPRPQLHPPSKLKGYVSPRKAIKISWLSIEAKVQRGGQSKTIGTLRWLVRCFAALKSFVITRTAVYASKDMKIMYISIYWHIIKTLLFALI